MRTPTCLLAMLFTVASAVQALTETYPMTIEHKFGTSVIAEQPSRIATVDYVGADDLLALGVQPITVRHWYGDYPRSVWPWADGLLAGDPEIMRGALNYEQIASTNPDVILALWSGITADDYEKLSLIAPVIAVPKGVGDFSMPWDERAKLTGQVIGKSEEAQQQVAAIRARLKNVARDHPNWQGNTASVAFLWSDIPGAYTSKDIRPQVLSEMGFRTPQSIEDLVSTNDFAISLSPEDLSPIDSDLVVWISVDGDFSRIKNIVTRPFMQAYQSNSEIFLDAELTGALSHSTLLSLPYAIDRIIPMIEGALE